MPIPQVTQKPDCGKSFSNFKITFHDSEKFTPSELEAIVNIDHQANVLHIWSDDLTLAGSQIDFTISVANSKEIVRSERLYVSISLEADEEISMKTDSSQ